MLNRFNNIENDDNRAKDLLIIAIITTVLIGMSLYLFLLPVIGTYGELKAENKETLDLITKKDIIHKELTVEVDRIHLDNDQIIEAFNHVFNANDFLEFCDKFFKDTVLKKVDLEGYKGEYMTYEFYTTMRVDSPASFYRFLNGLSEYKNIIQIEHPIKMEGAGEFIKISFMIKVYELDDQRDRSVNKRKNELFDE